MYFIFAILWLVCGVGVLAYQTTTGDQRMSLHLGGIPISTGWMMLLLSAYNFLRWWGRRAPTVRRTDRLAERRQHIRRVEEPQEPDPNFIFTEEPPPPGHTNVPPPSSN